MEDKSKDKNVSAKDVSKDKSSGSGGSSKDKDSKGKSGTSKDSRGGKSSLPIEKRSSNGVGNSSVNPEPDNQDNAGAASLQLVLGELKSLANSQKQAAAKIEERMDSQAAQISFLTDEWNLKVASNSKNDKIVATEKVDKNDKKDLVQYPDWISDSDDEKLEEAIADDYDEEDGESDGKEEEEDDFDEVLYGKDQKGIIPSKEEVAVFKKRTKLADEFAEDEWREIKSKQIAKFFVGRPEARDFAGPRADTDCPDLKYKNRKQNEKEMAECMRQVGAINLAQIRLAEEAKNLVATAGVTMGEFANPDIPMADPRQEASQSMEGVKEAGTEMMKLIGSLGKMSTVVFLKLLTMRRSQYVESVDSSKVARDMVKRLKPSTRFLFGDNLKNVCRVLKEGSQLSTQLQRQRNGRGGFAGRARGFRGRGIYCGYRGKVDFRGSFRSRGGRGKKDN